MANRRANVEAVEQGGREVWVQLATRVSKDQHRATKQHCVEHGISLMDFVAAAVAEKLAADTVRSRSYTD